jgi:hypothetical protein
MLSSSMCGTEKPARQARAFQLAGPCACGAVEGRTVCPVALVVRPVVCDVELGAAGAPAVRHAS